MIFKTIPTLGCDNKSVVTDYTVRTKDRFEKSEILFIF